VSDLRSLLESALAGRYAIGREIGRGGMAIVFLAHDLRHDRDVALKVLRPELAATLGADRFLTEIRLAARLSHPHILPLHDSGEAGGCLYYVMPYVAGESLRDRLEAKGQLPMVEALAIGREIADALDHAHRNGVVHRDIKPENILLQSGHAVVSDFGIARAISAAGERRTGVGIAVGTPDYMSPEQAAGVREIDGRSDLYSLGCVLFEMLAGRPPLSLTPPEGHWTGPVLARDRLAELRQLRPSVPADIANVVARLLAVLTRDRFATAAEVVEALQSPSNLWTPRSLVLRQRRHWGVGLLAAGGIAAAALLLLPRVLGAKLDRTHYVVIPFVNRDTATITQLDGNDVERLLDDAFGRWTDLHTVTEMELHELIRQRGDPRLSLSKTLGYAHELGAGRLVRGEYGALGDSIEIAAFLYDVESGRSLLRKSVRVAKDRSDLGMKFDRLADSLLLGEAPPMATSGAMGTRLLSAWRAYADGHIALNSWDLDSAIKAFRTAVTLDRSYASASLWLAQALEWSGADSMQWRGAAERAAMAGDTLSPYERLLANGLVALETGQYPDACARYQDVIRRDARDFAGWFGLGECQSRDQAIVRDSGSPSGMRFRTSYHAAIQAYRRALQIAAAAHRAFGLGRLSELFYTETNHFRGGFALAPDTQWYAAFPGLDHDTLAFIPYPRTELLAGRPEALPRTQRAAVARNRAVLREITTTWVHAFPESPEAHEALALVLESDGDLQDSRPSDHSAIAMIRRARSLAREPDQGLRLAVTEVRVLTKLEDFGAARALADSLLRAWATPQPDAAAQLAGLAALTGQAHQTAQLLARAAPVLTVETREGQMQVRPSPLAAAVFRLQGYAALGAPSDSIAALARTVSRLVDASIPPDERETLRAALLDLPRRWAYPLLDAGPVQRGTPGGERLRRMLWALRHGDSGSVRAGLDSLRVMRSDLRPGDVATTGTYLEARMRLAIGDSTAATELLSGSLEALPTLGTGLLENVDQAACLVRSMVLRSELAERAGDTVTAQRWARAVATLWSEADNDQLRATVDRMREVAGAPRK
jgi:serine/threonine protein kinase/tetratricopeptide (TPR) repeat protein